MKIKIFKTYKWIAFCILLVLFGSCKSGKIVAEVSADEKLSARAIIRNHYKNQLSFRTLSGRMKIDYSDGISSQGVSVSIRMEKDKTIWLSAPLGVVKAYITPTRVSFYNKLQNEYFDGDFSYLSDMLGSELDFEQVQNLLLGQAIFDLRENKYEVDIAKETYQLKPKKAAELFKVLFQIEPQNFKMATQQLAQPSKKRLLHINYKNYQEKDNRILPDEIGITAIDKEERTIIAIEYRNMEFNRPLNFPYKIPKGFYEIVLK
ncbi:DUF4292 domain-containing protein [Muriicola sp. Z0-33]|uniref:DUF4292 domain-containing protein n=1 Tax=Muriicola sp. Z0-33 TaxID=2816957 RepID=UPI0022383B02|nr:DUF4292 domain-containing protein [Muriicola sp. Z0-33]MCW5514611.1 DUF4292 domain-containing protein [Muriicola sp. Z0-33]